MTDTATLRRDIHALAAALEETRDQMEAGLTADLTGLDTRVAALCAEAQSARGDAELAAALERLLPTLDAVVRGADPPEGNAGRRRRGTPRSPFGAPACQRRLRPQRPRRPPVRPAGHAVPTELT
ncbi:hypothetical protein [Azospirillum baldaniorum]|uniref:Uncharacterized protein n=1 Tax=Azospirillum baldaniorum TaxID=1064539 RepID=A0A9P1NML8_9PROT|nr:hypothetical protein [Azospirillum baldaniorum]CCC98768.1 protein of unknown function [Azospirillum baldaniorum]